MSDEDFDVDSSNWQNAIEVCNEILSQIGDLPERAAEFGESVGEKVESIKEWIEEHKAVTPAQMSALWNMEQACSRWTNR